MAHLKLPEDGHRTQLGERRVRAPPYQHFHHVVAIDINDLKDGE